MAEYKYLLGNVKGPKGDKGDTGATGATGQTGQRGATGQTGATGANGADGVGIKDISIGEADSTGKKEIVITLTNDTKKTFSVTNGKNGTNGKDGATGATGATGAAGRDGVSVVSIEQTQTGEADGDINVVTFTLSNGKKSAFSVKNGNTAGAEAMQKSVIENASAGKFNDSTIGYTLTMLQNILNAETETRKSTVEAEVKARKDEIARLDTQLATINNDSSERVEVAIEEEKTEREEAVRALSEALEEEKTARAEAVKAEATERSTEIATTAATIRAEIKDEADERENAITGEQSARAKAVKDEATERSAEIATTAKAIRAELSSATNERKAEITAEETERKEACTLLEDKIRANTDAIEILNGDETTEGSVKKEVSDAIARVVAEAPEALNNLKEIADWIAHNEDDAISMNSAIQKNANDLKAAVKELKELIAAEAKARGDAIEDEERARNNALADEVTNRNKAIQLSAAMESEQRLAAVNELNKIINEQTDEDTDIDFSNFTLDE